MIALLERSIQDGAKSGFSAFRSAGELSWVVEGRNEYDRVVAYEQMVQASFSGQPAVGICMYPIKKFQPAVLNRVVAAHTRVLESDSHGSTSRLRIHWPECNAEIVTDRFTTRAPYHDVVQHRSGEILSWAESSDFDGAIKAAKGTGLRTD